MARKPIKAPSKPRIVRGKSTKPAKTIAKVDKPTSKQDMVLTMLRRQSGASIDEIVTETGWQPHSTRGFLSGAVKKRLGIDVVSEKGADGVRRYYVAALKA